MSLLAKLSGLLNRIAVMILIITTIVMTVSLTILIFGRNFFLVSFDSLEEWARFALIWMTFIGAAIVYKAKEHMGFEYFANNVLKGKTQKAVMVVKESAILILAFLMIYYGIEISLFAFAQTSIQTNIPMGYIYLAIPISGFMMLVHALVHIQQLVKPENDSVETMNTERIVSDV